MATTVKRTRGDYHKRYYAKNRATRLAYQRAYDAEHKDEKATYMAGYKHQMRHGWHRIAFQGLGNCPYLTEEEIAKLMRDRHHVLEKDFQYRVTALDQRLAAKAASDPTLSEYHRKAREFADKAHSPQALEEFKRMLAELRD
jgi:hypothetical protein